MEIHRFRREEQNLGPFNLILILERRCFSVISRDASAVSEDNWGDGLKRRFIFTCFIIGGENINIFSWKCCFKKKKKTREGMAPFFR